MPLCRSCGSDHAEDARFCPRCGSPLLRSCASCGAPLAPDAGFCDQCGAAAASTSEAEPLPSVDERKVVTVVFCDLAGSTELAERLDPEDMREVLSTYFDAMREAVEAEGGVVEKFIGDAVVAVFGVPASHEDDPARALRACRGMLRRLAAVNTELAERHAVALEIRVGVNTGGVLASADPVPGEALVTGDVVNVAARLQSAAAPGEVLVAARTVSAARGFAFTDRGELVLRGVQEAVHAHALTGGVGVHQRGLPGLRAPMVGRDAELSILMSVVERIATERRPGLVTVYGEAGVGKSRLVREFLDRLDVVQPVPHVVRGRCLPYGDGVTFWPLAEILKTESGVVDGDQPAEALDKIRRLVAALLDPATEPRTVAAALAYTVGIEDPSIPLADSDPRAVRKAVHAAWRAFFSALAAKQPVVVIVEDIHWADPALLDLLDELVEHTDGPVLFVCPSRPDIVATRPSWGGGRRNSLSVSLEPLSTDDSDLLVRLLLAVDDLPASVHRAILERAEGNPFFLEEILRRLIDERLVVREGSRWRARPGIGDIQIPDTVQGVLAARIDLLEPDDKRVLQAAAVIGRVFWGDLVTQLLDATGGISSADWATDRVAAVEDSLARLESRDLIQRRGAHTAMGDEEHVFCHILTRDVAYESIARRDRSVAHAVVARLIETSLGERAGELAELLAYHYSTAVDLAADARLVPDHELTAKAISWLLRASEVALCNFVPAKAQRLAQESLDLASTDREQLDSTVALARAYALDSRGDLAWQHYRAAALLADRSGDIDDVTAAGLLASACEMPQRWPGMMRTIPPAEEVRPLLERGLALVPDGDDLARARLLGVLSGWPFAYPEPSSAEHLAEYRAAGLEGAEIALRLGDADVASGILDQATAADMMHGHHATTIDLWQRRWALRDRLTDNQEIGDLYAMGAWLYWESAEYATSAGYSTALCDFMPESAGAVHARAWLVAAYFRLGRWDDIAEPFDALRDQLDERRDAPPYYASHSYVITALVHLARGERLEADRLATVISGLAPSSVRPFGWRGFVLLARGEFAAAVEHLREPPTAWEVNASTVWEARCDAALTGAVSTTAAATTAREAGEYAEQSGSRSVTGFAHRLVGVESAASGDLASAETSLRASLDRFEELAMTWEAARTRALLARVLRATGNATAAAEAEAESAAVRDKLGVVSDPVLDAALARVSAPPDDAGPSAS